MGRSNPNGVRAQWGQPTRSSQSLSKLNCSPVRPFFLFLPINFCPPRSDTRRQWDRGNSHLNTSKYRSCHMRLHAKHGPTRAQERSGRSQQRQTTRDCRELSVPIMTIRHAAERLGPPAVRRQLRPPIHKPCFQRFFLSPNSVSMRPKERSAYNNHLHKKSIESLR